MADAHVAEPEGEVGDANSLNPEKIGFMCGLEVHQQLSTGNYILGSPGNYMM
tara:strand:+ start:322 stop:477 length:156 start_codon:yes stop_codon:yes gene_type:complete